MKRAIVSFAAVSLVMCSVAMTATAQNLGTYTFDGAGGDSTPPSAANLAFRPFSRVNVTAVSVSDLFRSDHWTTGAAQDTSEYVEFTVTPDPEYTLNLTSLSFDVQRSVDEASSGEKDGPLEGQVQLLQGLGLTLVDSQNFSPAATSQNMVVNFLNFTTLEGETITFRIYGWDAGHTNGWLDLDNVSVSASATHAPEPSPAMLVLLGMVMFLGRCTLRRG